MASDHAASGEASIDNIARTRRSAYSLDPAYASGTGTPEPGGLTVLETQRLLRSLAGIDFVGGDLVEVSPPFDQTGVTVMNAVTILFEILCLLAPARAKRLS
jgi:guanidinopropionase